MSVLEKMGIQVWRMRGLRSVPDQRHVQSPEHLLEHEGNAELPAKLHMDSEGSSSHLSSDLSELRPKVESQLIDESYVGSDAKDDVVMPTLAELTASKPKTDSALKLKSLSEDVSAESKEIRELNETSLDLAEENRLASSLQKSAQSDSSKKTPSPSTEVPGVAAPQGSGQSVPKLRPAPVPFEPEVEMDLTIEEPHLVDVVDEPQLISEPRPLNELGAMPDDDLPLNATVVDDLGIDGMSIDHINENAGPQGANEPQQEPEVLPTDVQIKESSHGQEVKSKSSAEGINGSSPSSWDWRSLQAKISSTEYCPSCGPTQSTLGFGDVLADWMFIADAPTTSELEVQQLFVGRAGQLYENMLLACGLTRAQIYSSTVFKCSPPEDISIQPQCERLIHHQIKLVQPKVIVTFGEFVSQTVLQTNDALDSLQKEPKYYADGNILVIPSVSPHELLDNPSLKAKLWSDLTFALNRLN